MVMTDSRQGMGAKIRGGTHVDRYLSAEGALAQAVNANTIFIHSSLLRMSSSGQSLVLLHELAHLRQLASLGNDPVRVLEEEAWEAAYAWAAGRSYSVRGKAWTRLNALAII